MSPYGRALCAHGLMQWPYSDAWSTGRVQRVCINIIESITNTKRAIATVSTILLMCLVCSAQNSKLHELQWRRMSAISDQFSRIRSFIYAEEIQIILRGPKLLSSGESLRCSATRKLWRNCVWRLASVKLIFVPRLSEFRTQTSCRVLDSGSFFDRLWHGIMATSGSSVFCRCK